MSETAEQRPKVADPPSGGPAQRGDLLALLKRSGGILVRQRETTIFIVAILLLVYFTTKSSAFLSESNITNLLSGFAAPIIIIAVGEVLLLICGEIDLSVGFVFLFAPFLMHYLIDFYGVPVIPAILISLLLGVLVGWVNGFLTVTVGVPSFITTLGTGFILYGLTLTTSNAYPANVPTAAEGIGKYFASQTGGYAWSAIIWAVILVAIFHVVLTRTRWGLHTVAVGGNLLGARESGISVARIKYGSFMVCGLMGAIVGLQTAFYDNTIDPSAGGFTAMFYAVTAAVIGGTAMLGGSGTIIGAFLGAIVLATLQDGLSITGVSANPYNIYLGGAILIAMIANVQLARRRAAGRG
jgi:simple sugar transport system permease protein